MMFASSSPKLISLLAALAGVLASARAEAQPVQHPTLYYDASGLAAIQQKASDPTLGALGFAPAAAFASIRDQANGYRAARLTYTVAIPNPNGVGSVVWTYTMSSSDPPPHPNNPSYPPWTGLSRQIQQRMEDALVRVRGHRGPDVSEQSERHRRARHRPSALRLVGLE